MPDNVVAWLVAAIIAVTAYLNRGRVRSWFHRPRHHAMPEPPAPVIQPPQKAEQAEPAIELAPPDYGNIRPVWGEETDPTEFSSEVHEFPEYRPPVTRFEDFNRRLFILHPGTNAKEAWPNTTTDDYPTKIHNVSSSAVVAQIRLRLRPRYTVLFDAYGHWAYASRQLEQNPDYTDEYVETYLAMPEAERPVVVSVHTADKDGRFIFMRYGFENFPITHYGLRFHLKACLIALFKALTGPREQWLWFSVARMRQTVIWTFQLDEAQRLANEANSYLEQQAIQAKKDNEEKNRFLALWQHRIQFDAERAAPDTLPPSDAPTTPETPR
ncbi:hypothetical protein [Rhizobium sp. PP-CC-3G-465]|uniref:hypothetical protein n=1 Tax=Rhizobium sp. PP-CC-3G-465 TaxID=2135648 RepID=UPI0010470240